jgi:acetyltransferase EpsM
VIRSVIDDCASESKNLEFLGFLSDSKLDPELEGERIGPVSAEWIAKAPGDVRFIYALHTVKKSVERTELLEKLAIPDSRLATVRHPTAWVASTAQVGPGCVLMPLSSLGPNAQLGSNTHMYSQSFVGHDTVVGTHVFIANNASVGGRVRIENAAHIGSNATIRERLTIGEYSIVGAGSVVLCNIPAGETWVGSPARALQKENP